MADERKSDVWVEDCSIAAIIAQLAALSLGLGSCWVQIRNREHSDSQTAEQYIQGVLDVPQWLKVECMIAVGHPGEQKPGHATDELLHDRIREIR
jgi:nitroreductase